MAWRPSPKLAGYVRISTTSASQWSGIYWVLGRADIGSLALPAGNAGEP